MRKIVRIIDFETAHSPREESNGVIEIGCVDIFSETLDLAGSPTNWRIDETSDWRSFVRIPGRIEPDFAAIHQIEDTDLIDAPLWEDAVTVLGLLQWDDAEIVALAAHGIDTERTLLGDYAAGFEWVCAYKVALRLWPESPSHSNQCLKHFLHVPGFTRQELLPAHRALPDAKATALTLMAALNGHEPYNEPNSIDSLIDWTKQLSLLPRCKIGDYRGDGRGTPWDQVDSGFLSWILKPKAKPFDENTLHTARYHLDKREADQREERELAELNNQFRQNGITPSSGFGAQPSPSPFRDPDTQEIQF